MRPAVLPLLLLAAPAWAAPPAVVADTPVVQSLVATVMGDLGTPSALVAPGASPHASALSPSQAQALTEAGLVVWTGPALVPWVGEALASLAPDAPTLELLATGGWAPLPLRATLHLEEDHDHEGEGIDPHAWLDPAVAAAWMGQIAEALAEADPENAAAYRANAAAGAAEAGALGEAIRARLAPLAGTGYAVGHDAYQYLERAAGLPAAWALARPDGEGAAPGDVQALREAVLAGEVRCLLLDPEADAGWAATLGEGADLRVATVDPDGVALEPGPGLYAALMAGLAEAVEGCLAP